MHPGERVFVPTHAAKWVTTVTPDRGAPGSKAKDNVRETRGRSRTTALSLCVPISSLVSSEVWPRSAPLTRSGCRVGLIQLALYVHVCVCVCVCVCVFWIDLVIENSCKRNYTENSMVCVWAREKGGGGGTASVIAYPIFPQF